MSNEPGGDARRVAPSFFPLDEELELLPGRLSPGLQQAVTRLGASLPFGQVPAIVEMLVGVSLTESMVRRCTEHAGSALVAIEEARVREIIQTLPQDPVGAQCQQLSVDGAMVPIRGGEWREVKTLAIGEIRPVESGTTQHLSYVSRLQEHERFAWSAIAELHRRGTFAAEQVVAVVDGARWCQCFIDYHRPDAIRILDFPHVIEHLSQAAQSCFGPGTAPVSEWLAQQRTTLLTADPTVVLQAVADLPVADAPDPPTARQVRDQVIAYLQSRLAQMTYAAFQAQGLPIASGVVESANKLVVEARLKGAGMHWAVPNVDPMLALRCAICNETWRTVWPQISRYRRQTARRSTPRPVLVPPTLLPTPAPPPPPKQSLPQSPYFANGKPTDNHPWKQEYRRRNGTTDRSASQVITKK